ncbi:MAG: hypothetical protein NTZ49_01740 [Candidatus Parcubacteria bacterium]|nr:hypothetical protein [Candidatus Parcubacteria bacterium]
MSIKLELSMRPIPTTVQRLEIVPDYLGKVYELIDYWESQPKCEVKLMIRGKEETISFVYAPPSLLSYIHDGEAFGAYLGNMFFINANIGEKRPYWSPYILLKLWSEKYIDEGLDETGKVKHLQSLWATIRFAGTQMQENELREFLSALMKHERSGYFKLDQEVRSFIENGGGDPKEAKRKYLENHHKNLWVVRGRIEEDLVSAFGIAAFDGYRNHAEAIISVVGELDEKNLYIMAVFLHHLATLDPGVELIVQPPFSALAYTLTRDCNGFVDLVKFLDDPQCRAGEDVICRLPSNRKTWQALSKRITYRICKAEEKVRALIASEQKRLAETLNTATQANQQFEQQMAVAQTALARVDGFDAAKNILQEAGTKFQQDIETLSSVSKITSQNLAQLNHLRMILDSQV